MAVSNSVVLLVADRIWKEATTDAGFLAGYPGLTRQAYTLDPLQSSAGATRTNRPRLDLEVGERLEGPISAANTGSD